MKTQRWGWNVGLPSMLWYLVHLGWQSCQLYVPATIYPSRISLGTHFCWRLSGPQGYGISHSKISKDPTGNKTQNLLSCSAVPQQSAALTPLSPPSIVQGPFNFWSSAHHCGHLFWCQRVTLS